MLGHPGPRLDKGTCGLGRVANPQLVGSPSPPQEEKGGQLTPPTNLPPSAWAQILALAVPVGRAATSHTTA